MTAFRILAERIEIKELGSEYHFYEDLDEQHAAYFLKYFKPTEREFYKYGFLYIGSDLSFRILILLFAEQHYLHYKKIDEK